MLGLLRAQASDPDVLFTGEGHAPPPLSEDEKAKLDLEKSCTDVWNLPDWLIPEFEHSLGEDARATDIALRDRAPISLRVNIARIRVDKAATRLRGEGIETAVNPLCDTALTITKGARQLRQAPSYLEGLVELQDASSQAVVASLPPGERCLDYCAGGGGKALALAAQPGRVVFAHDIDAGRMKDLAPRAERAGCTVTELPTNRLRDHAPFDLVLCDAPCSGSGTWRRTPEAKWLFTPERLAELCTLQDDILALASALVHQNGTLAYATCSVLKAENEARIASFLDANPEWTLTHERRHDVTACGDGFYTAHLTRL
jgi:16S rRNA (cytosine967-C5)-methyltransferase